MQKRASSIMAYKQKPPVKGGAVLAPGDTDALPGD